MNLLKQWEISHRQQIKDELAAAGITLATENIERIIEETSFRVRSEKHPEKCPYYSKGTPCHPGVEDLNCFLCACPNYDSEKLEGGCRAKSRKGKFHYHSNLPEGRVWDCSDCEINHTPQEIRRYLLKYFTT